MLADSVAAIERLDSELPFERYNIFNCNTSTKLLEVEEVLAAALATPEGLTDSDRSRLHAMITSDLAAKLLAFSIRMASAALQTGDSQYLRASAAALTLDNDVLDPRDIYVALAIFADAGSRTSSPIDSVLSDVARFATPMRTKTIIDGFVSGPDYMRSLTSMGVQLEESSDGPRYKVNLF